MSNWQGVIQGYKEHNEMLMKMVKERGDESSRLREALREITYEGHSCIDGESAAVYQQSLIRAVQIARRALEHHDQP